MTRRGMVALTVGAMVLPLAACGGGDGGDSQSEGSTTINVTLANHVWTTALQEMIPDFEKESGLTVKLTTYGEDQLSDQYNVKLNAGTTDIDVMMYRPLQEGRLFASNGWLADLTDKAEGAKDWDWSDFQESPRSAVTQDDVVHGVPLVTEQEILYYRKDLLKAAGLDVPKTLKELQTAVQKLHDPSTGTFGFVARGQKSAAVTQFSSFLYSMGGDWADDGEGTIASDEAVDAYELYGGLLKDYGPPGVTNMSWPQAIGIFAQGKAAFYTDADSLYNNLTDPAKSTVQDKVGFAQFPAGSAGSRPYNIPSWALGMNEKSTNKDNAWKFIEWATSKDTVMALQKGGVPGARTSVWEDPQGLSGFPAELAAVIQASTKDGVGVDHDRPMVVQVGKARDIVGAPIVAAIEGSDVKESATKAQEDFTAFLKDDAQRK